MLLQARPDPVRYAQDTGGEAVRHELDEGTLVRTKLRPVSSTIQTGRSSSGFPLIAVFGFNMTNNESQINFFQTGLPLPSFFRRDATEFSLMHGVCRAIAAIHPVFAMVSHLISELSSFQRNREVS
jgi:hypothetical protein